MTGKYRSGVQVEPALEGFRFLVEEVALLAESAVRQRSEDGGVRSPVGSIWTNRMPRFQSSVS